jgi:hypothetical protein
MSLNSTGSNPIISIKFGGIDFARCTIFFKKVNSSFSKIVSFDNENVDTFSFEVDPNKVLGSSQVSSLDNCQIGWTVTFVDIQGASDSQFSFDLEIKQDGTSLANYSKTEKIDDTSVTFGDKFTFQV